MISGAARLTAHGSASAGVVGVSAGGGGAAGGGEARGGGVAGGAETTVGCGVWDPVESLEPHPATTSPAAAIRTAPFTIRHGTAKRHGSAVRRAAGKCPPNH